MKGGVPGVTRIKNLPASAGDASSMLGQEDPLGRKWQSTPEFLSGKCHGQRSLAGLLGSQKNQARLSNQRTTATRR